MSRPRPSVNAESREFYRAGYEAAGGRIPRGETQSFPKRRVERRWHWRRTMVGLVLLYAVFALVKQEVAMHKVLAEKSRYQQQLASIQEQSGTLRQQLSELQSPAAIEQQARVMGLTKPGEVVYKPLWPSQ